VSAINTKVDGRIAEAQLVAKNEFTAASIIAKIN
jgi:hypothetical protein